MTVIKGKTGCQALSDSFVCAGTVTMDTAGGVQVITNTAIDAGDLGIASIVSDDTGTPITLLESVVTADTLTITRTDDGSSADDAVVNYFVFRVK